MTSANDTGANMQHIFNKNESKAPLPKYHNPVTSGQFQDMLRSSEEYGPDNPEPPAMKM